MYFANKIVLITGACSGIGACTAEYFAKLGASLALAGQNKINLENVASKCRVQLQQPLMLLGDLTNENDTRNMVEKTIKHYGKLDVLVNSAGILENGSIEHTNLEQYDRIMNINGRSIYHLSALAIPYLIQTRGNIVNVSSVNGIRPFTGVLAHCNI